MATQDWQVGKSLTACWSELFVRGLWSDITFSVKAVKESSNSTISAHKIVLAARSPVFQAMFYGPCAEQSPVIEIPDADYDTFYLFLKYLYTDETDLSEDTVSGVMQIAHKYQVESLLTYCYLYLTKILKPENACAILELALFFGDKHLEEETINFIDDNGERVLQCEGFYEIQPSTLEYILKGDTFVAQEKSVACAALEWGRRKCFLADNVVSGKNIRKVLAGAFRYIRFPTMPVEEFSKLTYKQGLLSFEEVEETVSFITGNNEAKPFNSTRPRRKRLDTIRPKHFKSNAAGQIEFVSSKPVESTIKIKAVDNLELTGFKLSGLTRCKTETGRVSVVLSVARTMNGVNALRTRVYNVDFKTMTETVFPFMGPVEMKKNDELFITYYIGIANDLMIPHFKVSATSVQPNASELDEILLKDIYGIDKEVKMMEATFMDNCRILEHFEYESPSNRLLVLEDDFTRSLSA